MTARSWFWLLAALYAVVVAAAWFLLPDRVPLHFGPAGSADRFGDRAEAVTLMGLVGVGMTALFAGLGHAMRRMSLALVNVPHRDYWTTPEREPELRRRMATDLYVLGAMTLGLLVAVQLLTLAVAGDPQPSLGLWGWLVLGAFLVVLTGYVLHMMFRRYRPPATERG